MSYAGDRLYDGYLRTNMPTIVSTVKAREIVVHLPCLTAHDRECIEAKRETCGNFDAMVLLLDCLKRRQSWPDHFIRALENCEHGAIAADVRAEYARLVAAEPRPSSASAVEANIRAALPTVPESRAAASSPTDPEDQTPASQTPSPDQDRPEPEENSDVPDSPAIPEELSPDRRASSESAEVCDSAASESSGESLAGSDDGEAPSAAEKSPVQETAPPTEEVATTTASSATKDDPEVQTAVEKHGSTGSSSASPVRPETPDSPCLSAPLPLVSVRPRDRPASPESDPPYSGDSERLEISTDEAQVDEGRVSSLPDLDGQCALNGGAAPAEERPAPAGKPRADVKYVATAVGVAACALLLAWKFKH
ncbi:mitochondrial antiviral-signaling protein [Corythoichthys intestinalis]|uniref:mitochondrial antiviral-signaling protein n=1 Tax=Corythoichthys intestinalis TaxID=161448 RepID=UPI0025A5143F|nr:mitochondrial antiviral-signaling protein [Corythoichthys intestinalis]